jgi:hypothetical protein
MKKIYLSLLSLMIAAGAMAQTAVTFNVNSLSIGSTDVLRVVGNFQNPDYDTTTIENPQYSNWDPANTYGLMTDSDADGIYSVTLNLAPARYEFKFVNGNDWPFSENVPSTCTVEVNGNSNRQIMVGAEPTSYTVCYGECADCGQNAVRLRVDMSTTDANLDGVGGEPGGDIHPDGIHVSGSFVNWSSFIPLQDWNGDKIWETVIALNSADPVQYKFINGPEWGFPDESIIGACGDGGQNRQFTVTDVNTVLPAYCWSSCDPCVQPMAVTFQVNMSASCKDTSPGVNLMGSFNTWTEAMPMSDNDGDGTWTITMNLAPDDYEYKFRIGTGDWEGIGNRQLTVTADGAIELPAVCFNSSDPCGSFVPPSDVTFEARPGANVLAEGQVMWVMGDFTQPNWQGGALQMSDADGDGTWSITVPEVCISSLFYKFRIGHPDSTTFIEESADFSEIGGCGVNNGTFSDNRQLVRTDANPVGVCWTFDTCESCATVSTNELTSVAQNVRVYPNPAGEVLNIQFEAMKSQSLTISIVNSLGQKAFEQNLGVVTGQRNISIDTDRFASGVYNVVLSNGYNNQNTMVIVK